MAALKYCLFTAIIVMAFCSQVATLPSPPKGEVLRFDPESKDGVEMSEDCIDQTDCDPYGTDMCTRSRADKRWAEACCREYCGFCNTTIPKKQNCDSTPPSFNL